MGFSVHETGQSCCMWQKSEKCCMRERIMIRKGQKRAKKVDGKDV